jgi:uncharacterized protein YgbK (DUF1537 family)
MFTKLLRFILEFASIRSDVYLRFCTRFCNKKRGDYLPIITALAVTQKIHAALTFS